MKKLTLFCCILLCTLSITQAQNAPLNKQQTLNYIEKLFKESYKLRESPNKVESIILDNKILQINTSEGKPRSELLQNQLLTVKKTLYGYGYKIGYYGEGKEDLDILYNISTEFDAKRLKKALEHLIEILKTEKSTDPFGE